MHETPEQRAAERAKWRDLERRRPDRVPRPGPGQESVWDYPRPPRVEPVSKRVRVEFAGVSIADTMCALRVCETSSPPAYYIPPGDVRLEALSAEPLTPFCEWKGVASYWTVRVGDRIEHEAAWSYAQPDSDYLALRDHVAFHAGRMDACWVGEWLVTPQPGRYYGGWITPDLLGPFKGGPGTECW